MLLLHYMLSHLSSLLFFFFLFFGVHPYMLTMYIQSSSNRDKIDGIFVEFQLTKVEDEGCRPLSRSSFRIHDAGFL